jgi:hypothetical protein
LAIHRFNRGEAEVSRISSNKNAAPLADKNKNAEESITGFMPTVYD